MVRSESELKHQREVQERLIDVILREKDEKAARSKLAAAVKEIRDALPEAEKKAASEAGGDLSEAALDQFNNAWFRYFLTFDPRPTCEGPLPGPGAQRREGPASAAQGEPRGDRQGPQGRRQPRRQDGRARRA